MNTGRDWKAARVVLVLLVFFHFNKGLLCSHYVPRRVLVPGKAKNSSSHGEGIYMHLARGTDSHMINDNAVRSQQSRESHLTSLSHLFSTLIGGFLFHSSKGMIQRSSAGIQDAKSAALRWCTGTRISQLAKWFLGVKYSTLAGALRRCC